MSASSSDEDIFYYDVAILGNHVSLHLECLDFRLAASYLLKIYIVVNIDELSRAPKYSRYNAIKKDTFNDYVQIMMITFVNFVVNITKCKKIRDC